MISRSDAVAMDRLRRRCSPKIEAHELGLVQLTLRRNGRAVRCAVVQCGRLCRVGEGRRVFVGGQKRGFMCPSCQRGGR